MEQSPLVYIASPYAGDIEANIAFAKEACRYAIKEGATPIAVHLLYPQLLNDSNSPERELGLKLGLRVLKACNELWLCGKQISERMQAELTEAERLGIPIRHVIEIPQLRESKQEQEEEQEQKQEQHKQEKEYEQEQPQHRKHEYEQSM